MKTCVIFNPSARGGRARSLGRLLERADPGLELRPTLGPGSARELARSAVRDGFEVIGAAGGDGTIFEVLNGIADEPSGLRSTRLSVIPLGTANVLAHELGIPRDPGLALGLLRAGHVRRIDCGVAEFEDPRGHRDRAHFAVVAGAGLDARAVQGVDVALKKRVGKLAYIAAALRAARQHHDLVRCRIDGVDFEGRAVLAGNGRLYAGAIPVFGDGGVETGRLHVRGVKAITPGLLWSCALAYLTGRWRLDGRLPASSPETVQFDADGRVPLQLDGEWVGWLPASVRILPGALQVLVP